MSQSILKSLWVTNTQPMPVPNGSEVVNVLLSQPVAVGDTKANDMYVMGFLPADCVLVDAVFAANELDTGNAHAMSFGILKDDYTDLEGDALQTAIHVGRNGSAARLTPSLGTLTAKAPSNKNLPVGFKVTAASTTGKAGAVHLSFSYRAVAHDA